MSYRVIVYERAERDVQSIATYIAERSIQGAHSWAEAARIAIASLKDNPRSHGLAPEDVFIAHEVRQALFRTRRGRTYRVVFAVVGTEVHVLHVRGPGQNLLTADDLEISDS